MTSSSVNHGASAPRAGILPRSVGVLIAAAAALACWGAVIGLVQAIN